MRTFNSIDQYVTLRKDIIFIVLSDKTMLRENNELLNSKVLIDNNEYLVKGVESFLLPEIKVNSKIGLLT